jgi:apolipoprotein N-acyltransferase
MKPLEGALGDQRRFVPLWQAILALLAGAGQAASLAWPLAHSPFSEPLGLHDGQPVWWLPLLSLGLLAWLLDGWRQVALTHGARQAWRPAAWLGGLFATAWLAGTFWWIFIALHTYGGLPAVLSVVAVIALAALLAIYYAAVCGSFVALATVRPAWAAIIFASLWLLAELARGVWLTGFGWGAVAYAQLDGPLMAYAPWIGMYGLCALVAWLVMTVAQAVRSRSNWLAVSLAAVALVAPVVGGAPWASTTSAGRLEVTLLQGNIPQDEKFEPGSGVPLALQWYHEQLLASRTSLVIAPETAIPLLPQQLRPDYWPTLQNRFATGDQAALIGMPLGNYEAGYTNSVVGILPGQETLWRYDKQHLVPFGEFIPPLFKWFTEMMNIPLGDFNRGAKKQALFDWQGQRLALNICYEDLFGEELGLQFSDPAQTPTVFVNVSNLAWFGNSLAMDQHLHIARMRALEFARPFVLATNTGATAIVDYQGRVVSALARDTRGVLVTEVEGREGVTPFATWVARFGLWPYWALIGVVLSLAAWGALRKRQVAAIQPA